MIIVTGVPRSHTSMIMQTINILGIKCNHEVMWNKYNEKGYWECPETIDGIDTFNKEKNQGIKIILNSLTKNCQINKNDKIIFCIRHPYLVAKSQINSKLGFEKIEDNLKTYKKHHQVFKEWKNDKESKFLFLDTDKMMIKPEIYIKKIIKFLDLKPSFEMIEESINNVESNNYNIIENFEDKDSLEIYEEFLTWQE